MLNIHLKIEAKKYALSIMQRADFKARKPHNFEILYRSFERCNLLNYKVQKLSKRARRDLL